MHRVKFVLRPSQAARNWIAVNAVQQSNSIKNKNKKNDNSTLNKINRPVAFAACFLLIPLVFACFAVLPAAQAVLPAPDGGYPGQNTAEGDDALFSLTTGTDNTANGFHALFSNTTGSENTANGSVALASNTTGNWNTANGFGCAR